MRAHKQEANKIGEASVTYQYPGHARSQYFSPYSKLEDVVGYLSVIRKPTLHWQYMS